MKIKQTQKLTPALILTPQMRQSLYVLQLPVMELRGYLELQAEENPVLEKEEVYDPISSWQEKIEK